MIWPAFLGLMVAGTASLEARCAVAQSYIAQRIEGKRPTAIVFGDGPVFVPLLERQGQWYLPFSPADTSPQPVEAPGPSDAFWNLFLADASQNAVAACPDVRVFLEAREIAYGDAAVSRATGNGRRNKWRAYVIDVTVPTLSADGSEAILVESGSCGPLCGGGMAHQLRRGTDGIWRLAAFTGLYVS